MFLLLVYDVFVLVDRQLFTGVGFPVSGGLGVHL